MNTDNFVTLKVISRQSKLAVIQVHEVMRILPQIPYEHTVCKSFGDKHKNISLLRNDLRTDFFTKELDEAIIRGEADIAIHSAKDLPYPIPQELELIALTAKADGSDSLVVRSGLPNQLNKLPSNSLIGTSSPKRKAELEAIRNDLIVKGIRGTIEERIEQLDNGDYDAVIVATCALQRLGMSHRISERLSFTTHSLQGNLAIVARKDREDIKQIFSQIDHRRNFGKVYLIGFGPGNPDLLTIAATKALDLADVIYYDDLLDKNFLTAYKAEMIYVGKRKNVHSKEQKDINELLLESAIEGKTVVRLKGGDPMVFAHGGEEVEYLESNLINVEVIPGISTANALASLCKIPLTHRDISSSVAYVSGHAPHGLQIPDADTLVYYMAGTKIKEISKLIINKGRHADTLVALVHNVSLPDQQEFFYTLGQLSSEDIQFPTPVIIIIGDVVKLRFNAAKDIVYHHNILFTGLDTTPYRSLGKFIHTPLIEVSPIPDNRDLAKAVQNIGQYDILLFTSRNAVHFFFEYLDSIGKDTRLLSDLRIYSIGKITSAELAKYGIRVDGQAEKEDSQGVIELFREKNIKGNVLIPRSDLGLGIIPNGLHELGCTVEALPIYTNTFPQNPQRVDLSTIGSIVFTSLSCVDNFIRLYGEIPYDKQIIVKGSTTHNHLIKLSYPASKITIFDERV